MKKKTRILIFCIMLVRSNIRNFNYPLKTEFACYPTKAKTFKSGREYFRHGAESYSSIGRVEKREENNVSTFGRFCLWTSFESSPVSVMVTLFQYRLWSKCGGGSLRTRGLKNWPPTRFPQYLKIVS